jgi:hypothetical protein
VKTCLSCSASLIRHPKLSGQQWLQQKFCSQKCVGSLTRGKPLDPSTRAKIAVAKTGRPLTPDHRRKIGDALRGPKNYRWKGGLTANQFRWIQKLQKAGRPKPDNCEICASTKNIEWDHDHATGTFRGWICQRCNTVLGRVSDNPALLVKLAKYIAKSNGDLTAYWQSLP